MADREMTPTQKAQPAAFTRHPPNKLVGFLTIIVSGGVLLLLTGFTVTAAVIGLVLFSPLILISSPILVPIATFLFIAIAGGLSFCGFTVAVAAAVSWLYRYCKGLQPMGSGRVDYARSRIQDTASHMKDYAREYGGCFQSKEKDAAPGA